MVEEQCVAQARDGDASAFEELVRTYEAPVYRLALRMCGGRPEDAQEVAQEAFLAAWRGLPRFRGQCRFSSWLYKLTANAAVDHLRREKRRPAAVPLENAGEPADPHTPPGGAGAAGAAPGGAAGPGPADPGAPGGAAAAADAGPVLSGDRGGPESGGGDGEVPDQPGQAAAANHSGGGEPFGGTGRHTG